VRAHSSRKSARRNPIPVQSKRTILYIGEETWLPDRVFSCCSAVWSCRPCDRRQWAQGSTLGRFTHTELDLPRCSAIEQRSWWLCALPRTLFLDRRHSVGGLVQQWDRKGTVLPSCGGRLFDEASEDCRGREGGDRSPRTGGRSLREPCQCVRSLDHPSGVIDHQWSLQEEDASGAASWVSRGHLHSLIDHSASDPEAWCRLTPHDARRHLLDGTHGILYRFVWECEITSDHSAGVVCTLDDDGESLAGVAWLSGYADISWRSGLDGCDRVRTHTRTVATQNTDLNLATQCHSKDH